MNNDGKFWLSIWAIVIIGSIIISSMWFTYAYKKKEIMLDMVKLGASPVEAMIATHNTTSYEQLFLLQAMRKEK